MAESAAMALAAKISSMLGISEISFLTDNQLLANFFNGTRYDETSHWDIKPFTQSFIMLQQASIGKSSRFTQS
jgi:hypothetical protein